MRYIEKILQPGERLVYSTTKHWSVYLPGLALAIVGFAGIAFERGMLQFIWGLIMVAGAVLLLMGWFKRFTTEIDVTDKRVILKRGFISRETTEMNMDKIVSIDVEQSIFGRILDYGTIKINGAGGPIEELRLIGSPLELRNHITAR